MLKTASGRYVAFIVTLFVSVVAFMFFLEPKMILPSIIGMVLFSVIIYVFYRIVSKKSETEQKRIAVRNGKVAWVMVIVLLATFFIAAAKHNNVSVTEFIRVYFGF